MTHRASFCNVALVHLPGHADCEGGIVSIAEHIVYGLLWLSFGAVHSLLAGETAKRRLRP